MKETPANYRESNVNGVLFYGVTTLIGTYLADTIGTDTQDVVHSFQNTVSQLLLIGIPGILLAGEIIDRVRKIGSKQ